jgi:hypothetical protein
MQRRSLFQRIVSIVSTVALTAGMIASPIRGHKAIGARLLSSHIEGVLVPLSSGSLQLASKATPTSTVRVVKAISTANEGEGERDWANVPSSVLAFCPPPRVFFETVAFTTGSSYVRAPHPLRC